MSGNPVLAEALVSARNHPGRKIEVTLDDYAEYSRARNPKASLIEIGRRIRNGFYTERHLGYTAEVGKESIFVIYEGN